METPRDNRRQRKSDILDLCYGFFFFVPGGGHWHEGVADEPLRGCFYSKP